MPNINDQVMELEQLNTAITKNASLVPATGRLQASLEAGLQEIRLLLGTQKTLIADKQKVTQDLKRALGEARTLAMNIRAIAKGEVGARNEKLVEFGVAPLRPRKKRKPQQGPDEVGPATGKSQPTA